MPRCLETDCNFCNPSGPNPVCGDCGEADCVCCDDCGEPECVCIDTCDTCGFEVCACCENCEAYPCTCCEHCSLPDCVCETCEGCLERVAECNCAVFSYGYKPSPRFYGTPRGRTPRLWYGVELEVETGNANDTRAELAREVSETMDGRLLYCKDDGSLDSGFEIVSHPCTIDFWREYEPMFGGLLNALRESGVVSYNTQTCGMHVHVSKSGLSDLDILKMLCLFKSDPGFLLKVSRRRHSEFDEWTPVDCDRREMLVQKVKAKYGPRGALNISPRNTVEVRLFRGTLNPRGFFRNLEFVHAVVMFAKCNRMDDMNPRALVEWLGTVEAKNMLGRVNVRVLRDWLSGIVVSRRESTLTL